MDVSGMLSTELTSAEQARWNFDRKWTNNRQEVNQLGRQEVKSTRKCLETNILLYS